MASGGLGEAVHLLEAEDPDRPALLLRPWIARTDAEIPVFDLTVPQGVSHGPFWRSGVFP